MDRAKLFAFLVIAARWLFWPALALIVWAYGDSPRAIAGQLFAGTVRSNVTLGRPDATEEEIASALEAAQLARWVDSLPSGLETPVGEDGVAISGGERRRLAVARALVAGGPVLLLDEPTGGLDSALAEHLVADVLKAAGGRSVVLITHRASEAAQCNAIVMLEEGRVVS